MVKKNAKTSISEDDGGSQTVNENGKRSAEDQNKDGKKRLRTKSLYRQPTVNELNRLQETENLFNSNLFRLQVDEILQEVKLKEKTEKKFNQWFSELKTHLLAIPADNTEYDLTQKELFKKLKVKLPLSNQLRKTKCMFRFHKFKDVDIVGSFALGCPINSKLRIDLQITVPAETYTKNDSINYRYHKKRAAYLAYIAAHLSKLDSIEELKYSCVYGSETKPVLDFKPAGKLGSNLSVRINLVCEMEAYKLHRFSSERNNLREGWVFEENMENNSVSGSPTPYYNHSVLCDLTASINEQFLKETLQQSENLKQAIVLLKIWLRQRNLQVSGYVVCSFVAYFVQTKRINNIMSSYQIVRNIWIALKTSDLDTKGISLHKGQDSPPITEFLNNFPVVFLDRTGYYNICWHMHRGTYNALKRECALAVEMLDNGKINSFIPLFMTPVKPLVQFDHILRFKNLQQVKTSVLNKSPRPAKVNYGVDQLALVTDTIYSLLEKGLGNRASLILQLVEADISWPVKKRLEKEREGHKEKLAFGIVLNPENAMNIVEKGPPANLPEAEQFRAFWGDKSELRRFQDGSITETCVWQGDSAAQRRTISHQIVDYLMDLKFDIKASELFHVCNQLDSVTARKQYCKDGALYVEESSLQALQAFDSLRRDLRQLTQLPLDVSAVYGVSPVFSYSSPLPALAGPAVAKPWQRGATALVKDFARKDGLASLPEYTPTCKAVVELGHSGKWPGDIHAFRCLKAAFHLQLAERLAAQHALPTHGAATHVHVLKDGLVFTLEIAHPKEITLLRREIENGVVKFKESPESIKLQCETVLLPRLRGALHGLHLKHPSFGPTVCLFKRWLSSHLLSAPHFPATVAELVVATTFLHPAPLEPPNSPTAGLVRALELLANFDWARDMIVLDFNEDMSREEIADLEQKFASDPAPPPIRIVTAYDGALPSVWSAQAPTAQVLARARTLARSANKYLEESLLVDTKDNLLSMFVPSYSGFDVLIHLHPSLVPHNCERVDKPPLLLPLSTKPVDDVIPVVDFHPVLKYLDELRSAFDDFALFFHDLYGGEIIAVLWRPDIHDYREFNLSNANALKPVTVKGETKYKVNIEALVQDFRALGTGLVREVTVGT